MQTDRRRAGVEEGGTPACIARICLSRFDRSLHEKITCHSSKVACLSPRLPATLQPYMPSVCATTVQLIFWASLGGGCLWVNCCFWYLLVSEWHLNRVSGRSDHRAMNGKATRNQPSHSIWRRAKLQMVIAGRARRTTDERAPCRLLHRAQHPHGHLSPASNEYT